LRRLCHVPMVTADQLVAHVVGDYVLQSDWMATHKAHQTLPAALHALAYTVPFVSLTRAPLALLLICLSHFLIDRWRLARYVAWVANRLGPPPYPAWRDCHQTGHVPGRPEWMTHWLLVIVDNTLHVLINSQALRGRKLGV
jgi:hypothetical protein